MEIETGLARRNVQVVPILVGGARMPSADELPGRLARLPRLEALELSVRHFDIDTGRLIGELNKIIPRRVVAVAPLAPGIPLFVLAPHFAGGSHGMHWPWIVLVGVVLGARVAAVDYRRSTVWLVTIETTLIWSISCITYRLDLGHIHYLLPWNHGAWPVNPGAKYLAIAAGTAAIINIAILLVLARLSRKQRVVHVLLPVFLRCMVVGLGLKAFGYVSNTAFMLTDGFSRDPSSKYLRAARRADGSYRARRTAYLQAMCQPGRRHTRASRVRVEDRAACSHVDGSVQAVVSAHPSTSHRNFGRR